MTAPGALVLLTVERGVAHLVLNRPEARNALNMAVKRELAVAIERIAGDPAIRAVLLSGAGGSFCSGGDIAEMSLNDSPVASRDRLRELLDSVTIPLAELEKPSVAAVEGHAHGAGLSLALACDLLVVSETAQLSCAFSRMGLVPDCGALYFLPRRLPMSMAKELIFTGRRFSGTDAVTMGLANRSTPAGEAHAAAVELAEQLASLPTVALGLSKSLLESATSSTLRETAQLEAFAQAVAYTTEDHLHAREAFLAKASPVFTGR